MRNDRPLGAANRVYPYEPQYPLWSDNLGKSRWVYLPSGTSVDATDVNWWSFPNGTKFVANPLLLDYFWQQRLVTQRNGANAPIVTNLITAGPGQARARTALGYLHANCANCHNAIRRIPGGNPMDVRFDALLAIMPNPDPTRQPGWANTVAVRDRIVGSRPADSKIYNRMGALVGGRMPPIATQIVDPAGMRAIELWINTIPRP